MKVTSDSLQPHGQYSPWNSPGQNTGVGSLSLLQGIFSTQGSNPGLSHCRQILYQLSHKGSPRILEWVACPLSRVSSWPRNWTWDSPALQADCLPTELSGKPCSIYMTPPLCTRKDSVWSGIYSSYPKKQEIAQFLEASQEVHAYE